MANSSSKKFSKFLIYMSGAIGIGILGAHIYRKKFKQKIQLNSIEKHIIKKELKSLFEAEYTFTKILLTEDSQILSNNNVESVFELNSIKYALDIYHQSRAFNTQEIKELVKIWFLNNVKLLEGYIGKIDKQDLENSISKLDKASNKLKKMIKDIGIYDSLVEDKEIQGYIIGTYAEIHDANKKNDSVARYIYNLTK